MIRLEEVRVRVGRFALEEISFEVPRGGYGLVIGPTGAGKTTLLEAIAGHVRPEAGRILLREEDVTGRPPEHRRVGFVYQQYHLFPHLSVRDNIAYGLHGEPPAPRAARAEALADSLRLTPLLDRSVDGLSGGEQQRIALARALAPRPDILLLDEPFASVDPATRRNLRRELRAVHEREGTTTLQVTHDFDDALRLGDVVAVLAQGRIAQAGTPERVFQAPNSPFVAEFIGTGTVLAGMVERLLPGPTPAASFLARFTSGSLQLEVVAEREGAAWAVLRPSDLLLSRSAAPGPAPRNRFPARITRIEPGSAVVSVHLDADGTALVAAVTAGTAEELRLAPGLEVSVAIKATAVHLI